MDIITIGLFFGDEAKGSIIDFLIYLLRCNVIRYCGGSQCAHNVISNGIHHTFSQFGSGTFSGVPTIMSKYMLVDPLALMYEAELLKDKGITYNFEQIYISDDCLIITPFQISCGILKEMSREVKHGSCAKGVGETVRDSKINSEFVIRAQDLKDSDLIYKLNNLRAVKLDQIHQLINPEIKEINKFNKYSTKELTRMYGEFADKVNIVPDTQIKRLIDQGKNIWEGGQGTLLDYDFGFKPFVTKTNTSGANAINLLANKKAFKLGIMRGYGTRHGMGPFPTEEIGLNLEEKHNRENWSQGKFRQGWLDLVLLKYAIAVNNGIDGIALSCLDNLSSLEEIKVCVGYEYVGKENRELLENYFYFDYRNKIIDLKVQEQDEVISKLLMDCKPMYASLPGWQTDISKITNPKALPKETMQLIEYIEDNLVTQIDLISVGPDRSQKVFLNDLNLRI